MSLSEAWLEAPGVGLNLLTGPNGSGKSSLARELAARVPGSQLLSAESQQAFYEALLRNDESSFCQGVDNGPSIGELLGQAGRAHPLFTAFRLEALWERGYKLLSTGEGRKLLLLRALLQGPALLVLDEPFDGLDAAAQRELAAGLVHIAQTLPVLLVGSFRASSLPVALEALHEVYEVERGQNTFRGTPQAWRTRQEQSVRSHRAPPVDTGSFFEQLDPALPLVQLKNGRVAYDGQPVFENLDFTVHKGQHTLIEGPNGSGKSTLLEMITGDHPQAYNNDLTLFGRRRGSGETVWDIKKNVGLVSSKLHRDYRVGGSIEEVLISGLFDSIGVYCERTKMDRARAQAWLTWLGLDYGLEHAFRELSFGEQRLVLIARAAIKVPPLLVMDEPSTGLDADNRARVLELVESLCTQQKSTVLFVSHRTDERDFWTRTIRGAQLKLG